MLEWSWNLNWNTQLEYIIRFVIVPVCLDVDCSHWSKSIVNAIENSIDCVVLADDLLLCEYGLGLSIAWNYHPLLVSSSKSLDIVDITTFMGLKCVFSFTLLRFSSFLFIVEHSNWNIYGICGTIILMILIIYEVAQKKKKGNCCGRSYAVPSVGLHSHTLFSTRSVEPSLLLPMWKLCNNCTSMDQLNSSAERIELCYIPLMRNVCLCVCMWQASISCVIWFEYYSHFSRLFFFPHFSSGVIGFRWWIVAFATNSQLPQLT